MTPSKIYQSLLAALPPRYRYVFRKSARWIYYLPHEIYDSLRGERSLPPRSLRLVGDGDFVATGQQLLKHMISLDAVSENDRVLDIGCGVGRIALRLAEYLDSDGSYVGFDIMEDCVRWSQKNISNHYPNFDFHHANIFNANYNPSGDLRPETFTFPVAEDSIDFAFATSVFTHMGWTETLRYIQELSRVLKPGGRAYLTFYLLNDERDSLTKAGKTHWVFAHESMGGYARERDNPEAAIAFDEERVLNAFSENGLEPVRVVHGSWAAGDPETFQDVVLVQRGDRSPG